MRTAGGRRVLVLVFLGYRKVGYRRTGVKWKITDDRRWWHMIHVSSDPNEIV